MKFFLDTAELSEIKEANATGLIDGVTTNPSLVAKSGEPFEDLVLKICKTVDGPISAEVTATDCDRMVEQGKKLAAIHPNVVIKVPLTMDGLKATGIFSKLSLKTNVTLCFTAVQALLAAKAGATYISPFIGRLDDIGHDGCQLIADIRKIYDIYGFKTQILAASIRHVEHMLRVAQMGAHVATLPYSVFKQLVKHPLTDQGLDRFLKDWEKAKHSMV